MGGGSSEGYSCSRNNTSTTGDGLGGMSLHKVPSGSEYLGGGGHGRSNVGRECDIDMLGERWGPSRVPTQMVITTDQLETLISRLGAPAARREREPPREDPELVRLDREHKYDKIIRTFAPYTEGNLTRYFAGLESQLEERNIPQEYWKRALLSKLPSNIVDKASTALANGDDYLIVKDQIITNCGRTLREIGSQMFPRRSAHMRDRRELAKFIVDEEQDLFINWIALADKHSLVKLADLWM